MLKLLKFTIVLEIALYTKKIDFHSIQKLLNFNQMSWSLQKKTQGNIHVYLNIVY